MKKDMTPLMGYGVTIVLFIAGSWFTSNRVVESKIETAKAEAIQANVEVVQRVSKLEEAVATIKKDTTETKQDIKEILRLLK